MSACTSDHVDLGTHLAAWAGRHTPRLAIAQTVATIASAGVEVAAAVRRSMLRGEHAELLGHNSDGDRQRVIDVTAHDLLLRSLASAPVAVVASEESEGVTVLSAGAPLAVALDPLDGSANLEFDGLAGLIFSIRRAPTGDDSDGACFLAPGSEQLAAGMILFGPAIVLAMTVGQGTDVLVLDEVAGEFRLLHRNVSTPAGTREYAVNASNLRHWSPAVKAYVADLTDGAAGPRGADFNMRWSGALVADAYRILLRGGVFLYPDDTRPGYRDGRLRLVYEAQPIAMLFEQANGAATDGGRRILDLEASHLHARTPLVFGSADKVARVSRYREISSASPGRAPLFGTRGLFRDGG